MKPLAAPTIAAALLAAAGLWLGRVASLPGRLQAEKPRSRLSCKAVKSAAETEGCGAIEFDLTAARDGAWVLSHDPDFEGRRIAETPSSELKGLTTLSDFARGLERRGRRFDLANLDVKDRDILSLGRETSVLEANLGALLALSRLSRRVVISSPVFTKYSEIHRFIAERGLAGRGILPAFEVMDYTAAQSARWGLPLKAWERAFLPAARLWSRVYYWAYAPRIPYLVMQERTALAWGARPGTGIICWTRDEPLPEVPEGCLLSERARPGAEVSASARAPAPGRPRAG